MPPIPYMAALMLPVAPPIRRGRAGIELIERGAWLGRLPLLSLRHILALSLGGLGLASTLALTALITHEVTARVETEVGIQLDEVAQHMARTLDQGMFERWRDLQAAAAMDTLHEAASPPEAKRTVLERLQRIYPDYSIIGLVAPEGRIQVTSTRQLEGVEVSHREYFVAGRTRPFVGDVHDATLLNKLLPPGTSEPLRVVDLAAPVTSRDGTVVGVLVSHLDWRWARDTAAALARALKGRREGAEILILARDGTVLLGPGRLQGRPLAPQVLEGGRPTGRSGSGRIGRWPDDEGDYVSVVEETRGYRDYPGLGWRVAVRHRADRALKPVADLRRDILVSGSMVALGAALLAWVMAGRLARPLQHLARAATSLGRDEPLPRFPHAIVRETRRVAEALADAGRELRQREATRRLLVGELNHRVKNTLAVVQSIAAQTLRSTTLSADANAALEARLLALSRAHDVLTRESWDGANLTEVADQALAPYRGRACERFSTTGPEVRLCPRTALAIAMALQELATNAVKYGALSNAAGLVRIAWSVSAERGADRLTLSWQEVDGPPVTAPSRRGFGSRLIERGLAQDLGGAAAITFASTGVLCTLETPLA